MNVVLKSQLEMKSQQFANCFDKFITPCVINLSNLYSHLHLYSINSIANPQKVIEYIAKSKQNNYHFTTIGIKQHNHYPLQSVTNRSRRTFQFKKINPNTLHNSFFQKVDCKNSHTAFIVTRLLATTDSFASSLSHRDIVRVSHEANLNYLIH